MTTSGRETDAVAPVHVAAVIVTYHPDLELLARVVAAIVTQVQMLVIVDNTGDDRVARRFAESGKPPVIALPSNIGLAGGHNVGIRWAREQAATHVLLLDQDSEAEPGMVERLSRAWQTQWAAGEKVAALGPQLFDPRSGHAGYFVSIGTLGRRYRRCTADAIVPADFLISSGTLISCEALDVVGLMEERLFIEHVDTEWCFRARAKGYRLFGICSARMNHRMGESRRSIWLGGWFGISVHAPLRTYYLVRNGCFLLARGEVPLGWKVTEVIRLMALAGLQMSWGPRRFAVLRMAMRGLFDALRGRGGAFAAWRG